ncbi:unnamed protein product, partial [Meganyctiphanes norvegica]
EMTAKVTDETSTVGPILYPCTTNENCTSLLSNSECINEECVCTGQYPVIDIVLNTCFKPAALNSTCRSTLQCERTDEKSLCDPVKKLCMCVEGFNMKEYPEVGFNCVEHKSAGSNVDPTMIIILGVMAAMFVIICVVLRLFSKARFRENRSIFNTPNPRLMNASLFKDSKLLSPAHDARRGSRASIRPPSRAPSVTSVNISGNRSRTGSRNGSIAAQGRRGSAISTASAAGSTTGGGGRKTPSPIKESKKETSVAIETVD